VRHVCRGTLRGRFLETKVADISVQSCRIYAPILAADTCYAFFECYQKELMADCLESRNIGLDRTIRMPFFGGWVLIQF
jgi:hypothetical protein